MKAIVFTRYGTPGGLRLEDVPKPAPNDNELLIRIHASSINSWDWEFLNGKPFINRLMFGLLKPKPTKRKLGADVAGTVESVGSNVTRFQAGDEVFGDLWDNWGGFAEYVSVNENMMEAKPANITFAEAAAVPQAGVLALQGIRKAAALMPGKKVLINGAGGGVGTFAIQLAKLSGAEVTGVDALHKLEVVRSIGADHVIDYEQTDFTQLGERYDLIIDCQNFRSIFVNRRVLKPGGTYAMIGGSMTRAFQLWLFNLVASRTRDDRKLGLVTEGPNCGLADLRVLIEEGKLVPVVDRSFHLSDVPDALRYFGNGRHKGKIAVNCVVE
jgi:NADPH:quinone reductase-like Zn-dependent oxidoreductase